MLVVDDGGILGKVVDFDGRGGVDGGSGGEIRGRKSKGGSGGGSWPDKVIVGGLGSAEGEVGAG